MQGTRAVRSRYHRLRTILVTLALASSAGAAVVSVTASPASANTLGYPSPDMQCVHAPYATSGAGYWCSGYEWGTIHDNTSGSSTYSSRGYAYRNCTDYVAWKLQSLGVPDANTRGLRNGGQWYDNTPSSRRGTTPAVGAAAVRPTSSSDEFGHVAYVESVTYKADGSVDPNGNITVSEYNYGQDGNGGTRTGKASTLGFTEFVYFASLMTSPPAADPVTAVSSQQVGDTEHVYWATATGVLRETWFNTQSGAFTNTIKRFGHNITALSSQYSSADMAQHVYVGTDNGEIDEVWWSPNSGGYQEWNAWTSDGPIYSMDSRIDSGGTTHVYWGSGSGHVDETWFNPSQGAHTWEIFHSNSAVYGITNQYTSDGIEHVYWGNNEGRLHESYFKPGWGPFINVMDQFPQAISGLSSQATPDGVQHVLSSDNDGVVRDTWFTPSNPGSGYHTLTMQGYPSALHAVSSKYTTADNVVHAYTGDSGEVDETCYNPLNHWAPAINTPYVSSISSQIDSGETTHLFWGSTDGGVRETWFHIGAVNTWQLPTSA